MHIFLIIFSVYKRKVKKHHSRLTFLDYKNQPMPLFDLFLDFTIHRSTSTYVPNFVTSFIIMILCDCFAKAFTKIFVKIGNTKCK